MSLRVHFESDGTVGEVAVRRAGAAKDAGVAFEINRQLGDPATYTDCSSDFIAHLNVRRESLDARIAELEESWLEMEMSLEGAV